MKTWLGILGIVVGLTACGGSGGSGPLDQWADGGADSGSDSGTYSDSTADADWDLWEGLSRPDTSADAPTDTPPDTAPGPDTTGIQPPPKGPVPGLFDCTHDPAGLPGRVSPVSLGCVIDPECHEPMVVAHRGAGGDGGVIAPENSLSAFRAAIVMGVDGVEVDVRVTADEQLVLMHDGSLDRTTGVDAEVGDMTLAEITAIPLLPSDKWDGDFSCDTVPTFQEVLELCKDRVYLDVDMKTSRGDLVALAIEEAGMLDQAFVSTGSVDTALMARQAVPGVRVQFRAHTPEELQAGLDIFDPDPEIIEVHVEELSWSEPVVHGAELTLFTDVFIEDVLVVVLGQPATTYLDLYDQGADVLQTEYPQYLVKLLGREFPRAE